MISSQLNLNESGKDHRLRVARVETYIAPYDYWHDRYQEYYRDGLRSALAKQKADFHVRPLSRFPKLQQLLLRLRNSSQLARLPGSGLFHGAIDCTARITGGQRLPPSGLFHPLVGQYLFHLVGGDTRRVCIDASDGGEIASPELLDHNELYFKTNYWVDRRYANNVQPFFNGNPLLLPHLSALKELRSTPVEYDFCFVVRVWGGTNEEEGIEHNIRLLEAAAKTPGKKFLLAYLVAGDTAALSRRLNDQGVQTVTTKVPLRKLWEISAKSRLNIIRLGMHACIPWRMADLLAMGCCPVLDQSPKTAWPARLREGVHYLSLGADTPQGSWLADDSCYEAIPRKLAEFVEKTDVSSLIKTNSAAYFDEHLALDAVGRKLCDLVEEDVRREGRK